MAITAENSSVDDLEGKETANTMMSRSLQHEETCIRDRDLIVSISGYIALLVCFASFLGFLYFVFITSPSKNCLCVQRKLFRCLVLIVVTIVVNHTKLELVYSSLLTTL